MNTNSSLHISPSVRALGIVPVACLFRNLTVRGSAAALDEAITAVEATIENRAATILESAVVQGSQTLFSRLGYPDQSPAGEQLVKLIRSRGFNRHNNVVDAYNVVGARTGAILGLYDAALLHGDVRIRRARGGETMVPIFHDGPVTAARGDLLWETETGMLALLGPISRDADRFKVTSETKTALLVVPGNPRTTSSFGRSLCRRTFALIRRTCPHAEMAFLDVERDGQDQPSKGAPPDPAAALSRLS